MKKTSLIIIIIYYIFPALCFSQNQSRQYQDLGQAYSYLNGQDLTLAIIENEFPSLGNDIKIAEIEFDLSFGNAKKNIESKFIESKKIVLDNNSGGQIIFEQNIQRLDILVKTKAVEYSTIIDNKMILLQCTVSSIDDENLDSRFEKNHPLFKQVGNSLVFMNQY